LKASAVPHIFDWDKQRSAAAVSSSVSRTERVRKKQKREETELKASQDAWRNCDTEVTLIEDEVNDESKCTQHV